MASDGAGNLFVADGTTLRKIVIATGVVSTLAGSPNNGGSSDGVGAAASFMLSLSGVASDGVGNLFVADSMNSTIRQIVVATAAVTTLAGSPSKMFSSGTGDGTGAAAWFANPQGVASDGTGNLFVVDWHPTLRKVAIATGTVTTLAGSVDHSGSDDGIGAAAQFVKLQSVASDGAGNLFIADYSTIRKVVIATGAVTTLAAPPGYRHRRRHKIAKHCPWQRRCRISSAFSSIVGHGKRSCG